GSVIFTIFVKPTVAGAFASDATVAADQTDTVSTNNRSVVTKPVSTADLAVSQNASTSTVIVGDELTLTAFVKNRGPVDVTTNVSFHDVLPAGLTVKSLSTSQGTIANFNGTIIAELGPLAAGQQAAITMVVVPTQTGTLSNTVRVGSSLPDDDATNDFATTSVTVTNAPGQIALATTSQTVRETDGSATFTVTRAHGSQGAVSVHYAVVDGTAVGGVNFTPTSGTLVFQDGQTSQTITVPVLHDGVTTGTLSARLVLSSPTGGATLVGPSSATLSIVNTDADLTAPFVSDVSLLGSSTGITSIVVSFNEALDPNRATDPNNFVVLRPGGGV